jgi:hypothetical protein
VAAVHRSAQCAGRKLRYGKPESFSLENNAINKAGTGDAPVKPAPSGTMA